MNGKKIFCLGIIAALFLFCGFAISYAGGELVLRGTILNVNSVSNLVQINVQSKSCPGIRNFRFDTASGLNSGMTGKWITFKIKSPVCGNSSTIYFLIPVKI